MGDSANRVRIDRQLLNPLQIAADEHYYDLTGFVNYLLRMYLIGNLSTTSGSKSLSKNILKQDTSEDISNQETATELPEFLSDIDIGA